MCVCVCGREGGWVHGCVCLCVSVCECVCGCMCVCVSVCECVCGCMCVCVCVWMYGCMGVWVCFYWCLSVHLSIYLSINRNPISLTLNLILGFLNSYFPGWYSMPAANRLPFRYNALRTSGVG